MLSCFPVYYLGTWRFEPGFFCSFISSKFRRKLTDDCGKPLRATEWRRPKRGGGWGGAAARGFEVFLVVSQSVSQSVRQSVRQSDTRAGTCSLDDDEGALASLWPYAE